MDGVFMGKLMKRVCFCLVLAAFVWCGTVLADREQLNEGLIRLHVVANSDSGEDQQIKLQVRDAVVESLRVAMADVADVALPYIIRTEADQAAVEAAFGPATKLAANGWLLSKPMTKKAIEAAGLELLAVRPVFQ